MTVTVLVAVLTEVVVLVTVLLDGGWVVVVDGASVAVGVDSEAVGDSVTVSVVPPDAGAPGAPELGVLPTDDVADVPAGLVPVPLPANLTTA